MKEIETYIASVNTCDEALIRQIWSATEACSMIFPKGEVNGLDEIIAKFYNGAMQQYETRQLHQDDIKIQELTNVRIVRFYWTLDAIMKDSKEAIQNKGRETQIYQLEQGQWRLVHVHYSRLPE